MTKYTAWADKDRLEWTFTFGESPPPVCLQPPEKLKTVEADSYPEAMQKFYDWLGWGKYKYCPCDKCFKCSCGSCINKEDGECECGDL